MTLHEKCFKCDLCPFSTTSVVLCFRISFTSLVHRGQKFPISIFFPHFLLMIFLRHKSRCHPEILESDPETLESDPETLESVKRQAERAQGYIVQVK